MMLPKPRRVGTGSLTENRDISMMALSELQTHPGLSPSAKILIGFLQMTRVLLSWDQIGDYPQNQNGPVFFNKMVALNRRFMLGKRD
jgi:hypothetical protein